MDIANVLTAAGIRERDGYISDEEKGREEGGRPRKRKGGEKEEK